MMFSQKSTSEVGKFSLWPGACLHPPASPRYHNSPLTISESSSTYNLEGLEPNTHYHVRSRSRNKAGLSDASNIIYLHTHSLNAYPRLGSISASGGLAGRQRTIFTILTAVALLR